MNILALTGAGISAASGIPTFEDIPGLKDKLTVEYRLCHRKDYKATIKMMRSNMTDKNPNDAHLALSEYDIPVITMNIDGLHQKAGSKDVVEVHGNINKSIVLYGEIAGYDKAYRLLDKIAKEKGHKILLVIGTSYKTAFANDFVTEATRLNFKVIDINQDAEYQVRKRILEELSNGK